MASGNKDPCWGKAKSKREAFVERLSDKLPAWLAAPRDQKDTPQGDCVGLKYLQTLRDDYVGRWHRLNDQIWRITGIMLPLSVAPYAVLANLDTITPWRIILLAISSVAIMFMWYVFVAKLFASNQEWLNRIMALEKRLGIYDFCRPEEKEPFWHETLLLKPIRWCNEKGVIKKLCAILLVLNLFVWLAILLRELHINWSS